MSTADLAQWLGTLFTFSQRASRKDRGQGGGPELLDGACDTRGWWVLRAFAPVAWHR